MRRFLIFNNVKNIILCLVIENTLILVPLCGTYPTVEGYLEGYIKVTLYIGQPRFFLMNFHFK